MISILLFFPHEKITSTIIHILFKFTPTKKYYLHKPDTILSQEHIDHSYSVTGDHSPPRIQDSELDVKVKIIFFFPYSQYLKVMLGSKKENSWKLKA